MRNLPISEENPYGDELVQTAEELRDQPSFFQRTRSLIWGSTSKPEETEMKSVPQSDSNPKSD